MPVADPVVIERWQRWREARAASLAAPDSWLGLIGLFWLEDGANPVGSDPDTAVVRLPDGAARLGVLECAGMDVVWHPAEGAAMPLATAAGGAGFAEAGFERAEQWARATLERLTDCPCEAGCPACVVSPKCGNANQMLDKQAARRLLEGLPGG